MKSTRTIETAPECQGVENKLERFEVVDLGPFDNNRNDVHALNDLAQSAGVCINPETQRIEAFLQDHGTRRMLGTLGGSFSIARDLNNQGEVVGGSLTEGDENFHGFIYRNNRLYDLNKLLDAAAGWEVLQAVCINNHGEIIAIGSHTGQDRIVLLRPRIQSSEDPA
jgi:probable HAF family extracellular repeat protein